jgi:hypothetical protein
LIIAAPFSAIMIVGALGFVELTAGSADASTIQQRLKPLDPELVIDVGFPLNRPKGPRTLGRSLNLKLNYSSLTAIMINGVQDDSRRPY